MRRRILGLLAAAAIGSSACAGTGTPPPSGSAPAPTVSSTPSTGPSSGVGSPTAPASPTPVDYESLLFAYTYEPTAGRTGGKVVVSDFTAPRQLDPAYLSSNSEVAVYAATMRTLFTITSDGHWKADLAARMPRFGDGTVRRDAAGDGFSVDLALRPNLEWSDGRPATMRDLAFTWRFATDPGNSGWVTSLGWDQVDRLDVIDDTHATAHFKEPFAGFYGTLGSLFLPEHYVTTVPVKDASKKLYPMSAEIKNAVTIGPFKYVTASPTAIELVRDPLWTGPADACAPRACLDSVTFAYYADKEAMLAAFQAGEVDVIGHLAESDYEVLKGLDPAVGRATRTPGWLYELLAFNEAGLGPGRGHPALKDVVVRTAIAQAIDKKALYRTIFPGSPVPGGDACVNAAPSNYWYLPGAACPVFDVAAANTALDDAGYLRGADGTRTMPGDPGVKLSFQLCTTPETQRQTEGQAIAKALAAIGIKVAVEASSILFDWWSDVAAGEKCNLARGTYDLSLYANGLSPDPFSSYYYVYHSSQIPSGTMATGSNTLRYSDPQMDAALDTLKSAIEPSQQVPTLYSIEQLYIEDVIEVPLYYRATVGGISARLNDYFPSPAIGGDTWNIQDWWVAS